MIWAAARQSRPHGHSQEGFELTALTSAGIDARRICAYMASAVEQLLVALEQAPNTAINALTLLPDSERNELLHGFNAQPTTAESPLPVHQRIAQVGGERLTYGELNTRANALAHHLIDRGVRPDDRVAVVARRGPRPGRVMYRSIRRIRTSASLICCKTARRSWFWRNPICWRGCPTYRCRSLRWTVRTGHSATKTRRSWR